MTFDESNLKIEAVFEHIMSESQRKKLKCENCEFFQTIKNYLQNLKENKEIEVAEALSRGRV